MGAPHVSEQRPLCHMKDVKDDSIGSSETCCEVRMICECIVTHDSLSDSITSEAM